MRPSSPLRYAILHSQWRSGGVRPTRRGSIYDALFRLINRSHNRIPEHRRKAELGSIFSASRSGNSGKGVTGALFTHGDWFVQTLEGDETTVRGLYDHLQHDDRHEKISLLFAEEVPGRVFGRWAMARVGEDGEPDIPLLMNQNKGGAVPASPRPSTPEQDELLEYMRGAIREA
ncbi:MAG: BLUF domain-containing protein [Actinomycetia bacterium]|nr:BLUF domain-containing protein [Actinomycetes bacterium]